MDSSTGSSNVGVQAWAKQEWPKFKDLGGMNNQMELMKKYVILPMEQTDVLFIGILLHGPHGCGKTMLAHAVANETTWPFYELSPTLVEQPNLLDSELTGLFTTNIHIGLPDEVSRMEIVALMVSRLEAEGYDVKGFDDESGKFVAKCTEGLSCTKLKEWLRKLFSNIEKDDTKRTQQISSPILDKHRIVNLILLCGHLLWFLLNQPHFNYMIQLIKS
ncbi:P-loop containing nucleoside triphosphate hydrolase [Sesbania bispinosa]|nr:P-loop containing nucleoside triphosphate hydrolase [Sesbania bispinosa]